MALNLNQAAVKSLYLALKSHAKELGLFDTVLTTPPVNAPPKRWCAIWAADIHPVPALSGLAGTAGRVEWTVVTGSTAQVKPVEQLDPEVMFAALTLLGEYSGNFTLGGSVLAVDLLGAHGAPLSGKAGWATIDGARQRVFDITLPVLIDNLWGQAP